MTTYTKQIVTAILKEFDLALEEIQGCTDGICNECWLIMNQILGEHIDNIRHAYGLDEKEKSEHVEQMSLDDFIEVK